MKGWYCSAASTIQNSPRTICRARWVPIGVGTGRAASTATAGPVVVSPSTGSSSTGSSSASDSPAAEARVAGSSFIGLGRSCSRGSCGRSCLPSVTQQGDEVVGLLGGGDLGGKFQVGLAVGGVRQDVAGVD